ncbi:MAG: shikimate kinase [Bdellovibrionota bacterium]
MRTAIVGHRGVGKTFFLRRVQSYFEKESRKVLCLDLDGEIEKRSGRTLHDIFSKDGESAFRWLELETFRALDEETKSLDHDVYLVFGAGFDPSVIPETWRCVWLRRVTDANGRIFLDRPRLDPSLTALDEFQSRYLAREPRFASRADEVLWLDEGLENSDEAEGGFVLGDLRSIGGAVTVMPSQFNRDMYFESWARSRMNWGLSWFELRDDLLTPDQMEKAIRFLPDDRVLVSFRDESKAEATAKFVERHALAFDWPVEFGPAIWGEPRFHSLHERREGESINDALARFPREILPGAQLKAALPVRSFDELREGDLWVRQMSDSRIFLPMSSDGRWSWYRLLQGNSYALNFVRDFEASAADQPTLLQWARRGKVTSPRPAFAAILGDPVSHSRTPMEQFAFFAAREAPVLAIRMNESEWDSGLAFLQSRGLSWAAVTAPLKKHAFESCKKWDAVAQELGAVNTLVWDEEFGEWRGANTDREGFSSVIEAEKAEGPLGKIAVWGGGGTLTVVKSVLPEAELFSVRTGENRTPSGVAPADFSPDTVVWAVARSRAEASRVPSSWKPRLVIDLNYSEDSPGRDYAIEVGCRYISGLAMFRAQAEAQRRFWETR